MPIKTSKWGAAGKTKVTERHTTTHKTNPIHSHTREVPALPAYKAAPTWLIEVERSLHAYGSRATPVRPAHRVPPV
ncbi:hypothetical protein TorRG33x02_062890, partial [Trema orientale]